MPRFPIPALALALAAAPLSTVPLTAAAQPAEQPGCIPVSRVSGWSVVDRAVIEVTVGANQRYHVSLSPAAAATVGLRSVQRIGLVPNSAGRLCFPGGRIVADGQRIPVTGIERIAEEAAAQP